MKQVSFIHSSLVQGIIKLLSRTKAFPEVLARVVVLLKEEVRTKHLGKKSLVMAYCRMRKVGKKPDI